MTPSCVLRDCDRTAPTGLCRTHRNELSQALNETRELLHDLVTETTRTAIHTAPGQTTSTNTGDTPVPWNDAASRVLATTRTDITRWDKATADRCGHPVRHPNAAHALRYIDEMLRAGRLNTWTRLDDLRYDLATIRARAWKVIDNPTVTYVAGICDAPIPGPWSPDHTPTCSTSLRTTTDSDDEMLTCPTCGALHSLYDGRASLLTLLDDELQTASECWASIVSLDHYPGSKTSFVALVSKWHGRGRISARGSIHVVGIERKLYRLGDVRALLQRTNTP